MVSLQVKQTKNCCSVLIGRGGWSSGWYDRQGFGCMNVRLVFMVDIHPRLRRIRCSCPVVNARSLVEQFYVAKPCM